MRVNINRLLPKTRRLKVISCNHEAVELQAGKDGKFWLVLGIDSGFESTNALYLQGATINVKPL